MSQEELVLKYIKDFGSISTLEAFKDLGITRLSAKIFNLRNDYNVRDSWDESINRYGKKVRFKRYYLDEKPKETTIPKVEEKKTLKFYSRAEEFDYYYKRFKELGGFSPIMLTLEEYKKEVEKLENEQVANI